MIIGKKNTLKSGNLMANFNQYVEAVRSLNEDGDFTFGTNWVDYVKKTLSEEIINSHINDLKIILDPLDIDIEGKSVIDIGCGSGLSSLSFLRMGAKSVYSIDIDPKSVEASKLTKEKFCDSNINWYIEKKSILDGNFDQYDFVYSWGVLHHTGKMWDAIENAKNCVKDDGYFYVALYRSGPKYQEHLNQKQRFADADFDGKINMLIDWTGGYIDLQTKDSRGMNSFHDSLDWLGGLPYEVCDPDELNKKLFDYERLYFLDAGVPGNRDGGNFRSLYKKLV
jgi:2-polyprenyl-6-hydroxyphenyl methylase/3-demethylubiquinone-9 3-methyltransferase